MRLSAVRHLTSCARVVTKAAPLARVGTDAAPLAHRPRILAARICTAATSSAAAAGASSRVATSGSITAAVAAGGAPSAASALRHWMIHTRVRLPIFGRELAISEVFGHAAFLLAGTAFLDPDILNLRMLSVASGAATLIFTYFHPVGHPLWLPFGWNLIFMAINAGHIAAIANERREADNLPPQAVELWKAVFEHHGVSAVDFHKLLSAGTWTTLRKGATLQEEGKPSASVFLLVQGGADVSVSGKKSHRVYSHQFIGDMGLSLGIALATPVRGVATVTTNAQTTCLVWPRQALAELFSAEPALASAFQRALSADVMRKLQDPEREAAVSRLWRARYESVLGAVLADGSLSEQHRHQLGQFREIHHVSDEEHGAILSRIGWSAEQYELGVHEARRQQQLSKSKTALRRRGSTGGASWANWPPTFDTPDPQTVASHGPSEMGKRVDKRDVPTADAPLAMWDGRRDAIIAIQERLNAFFGTAALEVHAMCMCMCMCATSAASSARVHVHVQTHARDVHVWACPRPWPCLCA